MPNMLQLLLFYLYSSHFTFSKQSLAGLRSAAVILSINKTTNNNEETYTALYSVVMA